MQGSVAAYKSQKVFVLGEVERPGTLYLESGVATPGEGLTWGRRALESRIGRIACAWRVEGRRLHVEATIPPNTSATVLLPGLAPKRVPAAMNSFSARLPTTGKRKHPAG